MVGMRDVAKEAGVSLSTVSLVVNRTGYVSDDMRERVNTAMKKLNYVPNELARNLYKNRTNLVGVIVPTIRHPFFATLAAHLQHELAVYGLRTMLCSTADTENGEAEYVDMLRRRMMDGVIVCSHTTHPNDFWTSIHRPIVAFDRVLGDGIASIGSDHEQGGRLIAHMLINTGAHHVAMVGGPRDQFFDLAAQGDVPDDFDLHKTTFPTIRYYLTLEQELKAAGVRYEYVEAGNVEDFQGYKNAVNDVLNRMPTDGIDAVISSDIGAALCVREAMRAYFDSARPADHRLRRHVSDRPGRYENDRGGAEFRQNRAGRGRQYRSCDRQGRGCQGRCDKRHGTQAVRAGRADSRDAQTGRYHPLSGPYRPSLDGPFYLLSGSFRLIRNRRSDRSSTRPRACGPNGSRR